MREAVSESERPVMLYSIGKDSSVMLHLAMKAFHPSKPPFPLLHVDTTWKFREMIEFRGTMTEKLGLELLVHINPEALALGINPFTHWFRGPYRCLENAGAETSARQARLRRGLRRREARRGEIARQGTSLFVPLGAASMGPEDAASGALAPLQRSQAQRREHARLSAFQLDRARHLAIHLSREHTDRPAVFRREASRRRARRRVDHGR